MQINEKIALKCSIKPVLLHLTLQESLKNPLVTKRCIKFLVLAFQYANSKY